MQIYSKSIKNATSPLFRNHNRSALQAGTYITHRVIYYPLVKVEKFIVLKTMLRYIVKVVAIHVCSILKQKV